MAKFKAVGNGVPLKMGAALANAVVHSSPFNATSDCPCGCGRTKTCRAITATAACRKRKQIASQRSRPWIDLHGYHVQ
jgi:DNA (cytosine-5)-methyltransferase 1